MSEESVVSCEVVATRKRWERQVRKLVDAWYDYQSSMITKPVPKRHRYFPDSSEVLSYALYVNEIGRIAGRLEDSLLGLQ
uniref:Hypothetical capsid protein n=1 Tax=uncultured virus TaxID=340016 RepID=A0A1D8MK26_9VIRU|nr:hypothetical capsid protein [uncultured virus]